jgi:hypothetical protein
MLLAFRNGRSSQPVAIRLIRRTNAYSTRNGAACPPLRAQRELDTVPGEPGGGGLAAQGGGLGLFTAISRLRAVYKRLVRPLAQSGLPLLERTLPEGAWELSGRSGNVLPA